jgi:hypothetical protein
MDVRRLAAGRAGLGTETGGPVVRVRPVGPPRDADPVGRRTGGGEPGAAGRGGPPVLDPRTAFAVHTCPGRPQTLAVDGVILPGAGFQPDAPDLGACHLRLRR